MKKKQKTVHEYIESVREYQSKEDAIDEKKRTKNQFRHDWRIAIFSALAGAFLSEPLWLLIHAVICALK